MSIPNALQLRIQRDIDRFKLDPILSALKATAITVAGTTESEFVAAVAQAQTEQRPIYLDKMVALTTTNIPAQDVVIISDWTGGFTGTGHVAVGNDVTAVGLIHNAQSIGWQFSSNPTTNRFYSKREKFIGMGTFGVYDAGGAGGANHNQIMLEDPYFESCAIAVWLLGMSNGSVVRPTIRNIGNVTNYGIALQSASNISILDPDIRGGRTGVVCLPYSNRSTGYNNVIRGGEYRDIAEEAISLGDIRGNQLSDTGLMDFFTISAADGSPTTGSMTAAPTIFVDWTASTIQAPGTAPASNLYANRDVIFLTGALKGVRFTLGGAPGWVKVTNTSRFTLATNTLTPDSNGRPGNLTQAQFAQIANGDKIAIYCTPTRTLVSNPTIWCSGAGPNATGIKVWGGGGHRIINPTIYGNGAAYTGQLAVGRKGMAIQHTAVLQARTGCLSLTGLRSQGVSSDVTVTGGKYINCDVGLGNWTPNAGTSHAENIEVSYPISFKGNRFYGDGNLFNDLWKNGAGDASTAIPCFDPAGVVNNTTGLPVPA